MRDKKAEASSSTEWLMKILLLIAVFVLLLVGVYFLFRYLTT